MPKPIRRVEMDRAIQNGMEQGLRHSRKSREAQQVEDSLSKFRDTSKPASPKNIRVVPKGPGPFRPSVKLDRSQVWDRRGNSKRSGR